MSLGAGSNVNGRKCSFFLVNVEGPFDYELLRVSNLLNIFCYRRDFF